MRSFIPALIGLATVAVAQNATDCVSQYTSCFNYSEQNANVCNAAATVCKNQCSTARSDCLDNGNSDATCSSQYNTCLGASSSSNASINCIAKAEPCYTFDGSTDNTCDSQISNCKTACGAIFDVCNSSGDDSTSDLCLSKYTACLGSSTLTTPSINCITSAEQCYNSELAYNNCSAQTAGCKQASGVLKDACLASNDSSVTSDCENYYESCLGSNDLPTSSTIDCVSAVESCYESGEDDNVCDAHNAQCKDVCGSILNVCNSSGDNSTDAACLTYYNSCLGASKLTTSTVDCVSRTESCYLSGNSTDAECDSENAVCKTVCSRGYDTCMSSGDEGVRSGCLDWYNSCLGSTDLEKSTVDCVTRNEQCYLSGTSDNECGSDNAVCKTVCARATDACLSSNDTSVAEGCYDWYNECLGATNVSSTSSINCVEDATQCFLYGTADNNCSASTAVCKTACSRTYDTCLSSGDSSIKAGCLLNYDSCLGATPEAEEVASSINCIERYTSCFSTGVAENECSAQNAQCKNTCSQLLDSCNSSGDNSTSAQCQGIYNSCLGSIATSLVDYEPLDCASRNKQCSANGTASNECDRENASCRNACGTTLDTCLTSGSSDSAACNHLYMMCLDSSSYTVTSIPASLAPTSTPSANSTRASLSITRSANSTRASLSITPSANATLSHLSSAAPTNGTLVDALQASKNATSAAITSAINFANPTSIASSGFGISTASRVGAFVPAPYHNGSAISIDAAGSSKTTKSALIESTVYVTDVLKTTITTCPVGQTITSAGKTVVLSTPSIITSTYTVRSTVSTTVPAKTFTEEVSSSSSQVNAAQTTTAPIAGHVAVPTTVFLYSTAVVTVTSCKKEVTNCPARSTVLSTTTIPTGITVSKVYSRTSAALVSNSEAAAVSGSISSIESTVIVTDVVKETVTTCPVGQTLTNSGSTTVLTTPSVITSSYTVFVKSTIPVTISGKTITESESSSVVAPVSSQVAPISSQVAPISSQVAVPSTVTLYSTQLATITSCSSDVTNCPARSTVVSTSLIPTGVILTSVSVPASSSPVAAILASSQATSAIHSAPSPVKNYGSAPSSASSIPETPAPVVSPIASASASSDSVSASSVPAVSAYSTVAAVSDSSIPAVSASSVVAAVAEASSPVSSSPAGGVLAVPTTAPFGLTNGTSMTLSFASGTGAVGTGSKSTSTPASTEAPVSYYTGAASKAGVAGLAGFAAFLAFLM